MHGGKFSNEQILINHPVSFEVTLNNTQGLRWGA